YYNFFFQAGAGIRVFHVTGVQTCALPISRVLAARPQSAIADVQADRLAASRTNPSRKTIGAPPISMAEWTREPMLPPPAMATAQDRKSVEQGKRGETGQTHTTR